MYSTISTFQPIESALSPPYDGSEFLDLFPELTGVEPDEMVDIESLTEEALESFPADDSLSVTTDRASTHSVETDSEYDSQNPSEEDDDDDPEELLRYLIGETDSTKSWRKRRLSSRDSGNFSENSRPRTSVEKRVPQKSKPTRSSTKSKCKTSITVFEEGVRKTVEGPNRNAVMAKLNRERKKQHMSHLEKKVGLLGTENDALKKQNVCLRKKVSILAKELQYVKGVLANQSALAGLLNNIQATGLEFHSSMPVSRVKQDPELHVKNETLESAEVPLGKRRKGLNDHDYCLETSSRLESNAENCDDFAVGNEDDEKVPVVPNASGVCLHVSGRSVSLEFCSKCSGNAKAAQSTQRKSSR